MSYKIRESKLNLLVQEYQQGGEVTLETIPDIIGIKTKAAIKAYYEAHTELLEDGAKKELEEPSVQSEVQKLESDTTEKPNPFTKPIMKQTPVGEYQFLIENDNGAEEEFELVAISEKNKTVVLKKIEPIMKNIVVKGVDIQVDLRKLRKMSPDDELHNTKVSTLLIAAELA